MEYIQNRNYNNQSEISGFISRVYLGMTMGLALTAITSYLIINSGNLFTFMISNKFIYFGLMLLELLIVFLITLKIDSISYGFAAAALLFYSILNGITLTPIFYVYTNGSVVAAFFTTSAMFLGMSFLGFVIKRDLGYLGKFFMMALIGFIAALIINIFLKSSVVDFLISVAGVLIFAGLTVYDTQNIRKAAQYSNNNKYALISSLSLYLNFVNMFINILRLLGRRS